MEVEGDDWVCVWGLLEKGRLLECCAVTGLAWPEEEMDKTLTENNIRDGILKRDTQAILKSEILKRHELNFLTNPAGTEKLPSHQPMISENYNCYAWRPPTLPTTINWQCFRGDWISVQFQQLYLWASINLIQSVKPERERDLPLSLQQLLMYNTHSRVIRTHIYYLSLDYEILRKKNSCIIRIDFLEVVATEFHLNLAFVQLFIGSYDSRKEFI